MHTETNAFCAMEMPSQELTNDIAKSACEAISERTILNPEDETHPPKMCSCCDRMTTVDNPSKWMEVIDFVECLKIGSAEQQHLISECPRQLVRCHTAQHPMLKTHVLSPSTHTRKNLMAEEEVLSCETCHSEFVDTKSEAPSRRKKVFSPMHAIWNGHSVGEAPDVLKCSNRAELAMMSPNRILTHGAVLCAGQHEGISGWHAMCENKIDENLGQLNMLEKAGLGKTVMVALCGPWTETQKAIAMKKCQVSVPKVMKAFSWTQQNVQGQSKMCIPKPEEIRQPRILKDSTL